MQEIFIKSGIQAPAQLHLHVRRQLNSAVLEGFLQLLYVYFPWYYIFLHRYGRRRPRSLPGQHAGGYGP